MKLLLNSIVLTINAQNLGWEARLEATRESQEDENVVVEGDKPSRGDMFVVLVPSRELKDPRRRLKTPLTTSGEEDKGKGMGARRSRGSGGKDITFNNTMRSLCDSGASVVVREVRDVPSSNIDVEAEVSVTTFLYGVGNDEGL